MIGKRRKGPGRDTYQNRRGSWRYLVNLLCIFDQIIMIQRIRCENYNHSRINVTVRACPSCGEIVNGNIPVKDCSDAEHPKKRKERSNFCIDCGKQLIQGCGCSAES